MIQNVWQPALLVATFLVTVLSWYYSRRGKFYADTFLLWPWGIFVWGDGLVLGPFWLLVLSVSFFIPEVSLLSLAKWYALFFAVRFSYETVYWINHQVAKKDYIPPLVRKLKWLGAQEAGIVYQLLTMCGALISLGFWLSLS